MLEQESCKLCWSHHHVEVRKVEASIGEDNVNAAEGRQMSTVD
jgi:hypothetical protein